MTKAPKPIQEMTDVELLDHRELLRSLRDGTMQGSAKQNNNPKTLARRRSYTEQLNLVAAELRKRMYNRNQ